LNERETELAVATVARSTIATSARNSAAMRTTTARPAISAMTARTRTVPAAIVHEGDEGRAKRRIAVAVATAIVAATSRLRDDIPMNHFPLPDFTDASTHRSPFFCSVMYTSRVPP